MTNTKALAQGMALKHEWTDFKASNQSQKNPGSMWTYYRCEICGKVAEEKLDTECPGYMPSALTAASELVEKEAKPAIPDGWKLVPVEPTSEMLKAAFGFTAGDGFRPDYARLYRAMLSAAPSPGAVSIYHDRHNPT